MSFLKAARSRIALSVTMAKLAQHAKEASVFNSTVRLKNRFVWRIALWDINRALTLMATKYAKCQLVVSRMNIFLTGNYFQG